MHGHKTLLKKIDMSKTKQYIEEEMIKGNDVLHPDYIHREEDQVLIDKREEDLNKKLEEIGFGNKQENDEQLVQSSVEKYYSFKIKPYWISNASFYIYSESTSDGYDVHIACEDSSSIDISSDVFYYDHDLPEILKRCITSAYPHKDDVIMVDGYEDMVEDVMMEIFLEIREYESISLSLSI